MSATTQTEVVTNLGRTIRVSRLDDGNGHIGVRPTRSQKRLIDGMATLTPAECFTIATALLEIAMGHKEEQS